MKKLFAVVGQFLLFLIVDVVGGLFYHPFSPADGALRSPLGAEGVFCGTGCY